MKNDMMKQPSGGKKIIKNIGLALMVLFVMAIAYTSYSKPSTLTQVALSDALTQANNGEVDKLTIIGNRVEVTKKGETKPSSYALKEPVSTIYDQGLEKGKTKVQSQAESKSGETATNLLVNVGLPVVLFGLFFMFMMRQAQGQGNNAMSFGKSKARLYGNEKNKVTFKNIAGNNESKEDLEEVVEFLKTPKKFEDVGAKIPKGVLLVGPPGTGKTMLAQAVAGEADVPFFSISGSEFVEMFVGVGASRVRDLFAKAKKNAPCIIFVDEIDAVGRKRGSGMGGGHDEREQTLNQILVEMDGFEKGENVIVLAATNRSDVLDQALLRPGRFDRKVYIGLPDRKDRAAILKVHFANKPVGKDVDIDALAAKTAGSSGADLANMANESAIVAARNNRKEITNADVTEALEKVAIGPERKTKVMSDAEKEMTAYHEGGHAIVGHVLPDSDMVHKVTIIPRGGTGGVTWFIPPEDASYQSIIEYKDILARMLGGRIAEEVIYGAERVTTGAGSDLQKAAECAREMITKQGMGSKNLRNIVFHSDDGMVFDRMMHEKPYSEETAKLIDDEVEKLIREAADRARAVIKANLPYLEKLKDALLKDETVEADDVLKIFAGSKMPKEAALY
jgi:cell division protease FtsH